MTELRIHGHGSGGCGQAPPDAFFRFQAQQPGLGVQGSAVTAYPDDAVAGAPAPVLHFNDSGGVNYARGAVQAGAPAADVPGVGILLKRMAKRVYAADSHAQPSGKTWLRTERHAPL